MKKPDKLHGQPANRSDYLPVSICFEDPVINILFAELLQAHGVTTEIIWNIEELHNKARVITEPQYYAELSDYARQGCLIVGEQGALEDCSALALYQPLTEAKIEAALSQFLGSH